MVCGGRCLPKSLPVRSSPCGGLVEGAHPKCSVAEGPKGSWRCAAMLLLTSALHVCAGDRTWEQMRRAVTHPRCPLKKGQRGGTVPQMGCEVYMRCPLSNRLRLMKCLMLGHISLIFGGSWSLHCQKTPPSGPLSHSGRQAQGGAPS